MRLYLAHPFDTRHRIREWELHIESITEIEIINPFFDVERNDAKLIESLGTTLDSEVTRERRYGISDEAAAEIVDRDIEQIRRSDGLIVIVDGSLSYGTIQEMVYAMIYDKPVYAMISNGQILHPWLRYHYKEAFGTLKELEAFLIGHDKYWRLVE